MDTRQLELSPSLLSSLGVPEHVGRGNATIMRTNNRTESLFDVLTTLRTDNTELRQRFADSLRRPTMTSVILEHGAKLQSNVQVQQWRARPIG